LFHRRQSKPGAAEAGGDPHIGLRKGAKQPLDLQQRETNAAIRNSKSHLDLVLHLTERPHGQYDGALFGELGGVVDQVFQRRPQTHGIAGDKGGKLLRNLDPRLQAFCGGPAGQRIADAVGERPQIEKVLPDAKAGATTSGGIDKQGRKARQVFGSGLDGIDPAPLPLIKTGRRQEIADGQNAGQRRANLMREGGERRLYHAGGGRLAGRPGDGLPWLAGRHTCFTLFRPSLFQSPLQPPLTAPWARTRCHDSPNPGCLSMARSGIWSHVEAEILSRPEYPQWIAF